MAWAELPLFFMVCTWHSRVFPLEFINTDKRSVREQLAETKYTVPSFEDTRLRLSYQNKRASQEEKRRGGNEIWDVGETRIQKARRKCLK